MKLVKKHLLMSLTLILVVSMTMVIMVPMINITSASPGTLIYVDPPVVRNKYPGVPPPDDRFLININVTDAPPSQGWEIILSWDPALLDLAVVSEGNFLSSAGTTTFQFIPSISQANLQGSITIGCDLGALNETYWPSGDGWLCRLGFLVEDTGSCVLNIFRTWLNDHFEGGLPAHTYYPNQDCFFYNEPFHDIVVDNVEINVTEMWVNAPVPVGINVTVKNEGNFTETFNVNVYADITVYNTTVEWWIEEIIVGDEITVGTQPVTNLVNGTSETLTFTWNTAGVARGNYTISAEVTGDNDTRDNLFIDGSVLIREHDLNVVGLGGRDHAGNLLRISVMVKNNGTEPETFNITVYADPDLGVPDDEITVGTIEDASLDAGAINIFEIPWNTTGVAEGIYTGIAEVPPVLGPPPELDTADNNGTGEVWVLFMSDIIGPEDPEGSGHYPSDGKVDYHDLILMGKAFGMDDGDPGWIEYEIADITGPEDTPNGEVEYYDLVLMSEQFGKSILD